MPRLIAILVILAGSFTTAQRAAAAPSTKPRSVMTVVSADGQVPLLTLYGDDSHSIRAIGNERPFELSMALFADGRVIRSAGREDQYIEGRISAEEANRLVTRAVELASVMPRRDYRYIPPDAGGTVITVADPTSPGELAYYLMLWERGNYKPQHEEQQRFMVAWSALRELIKGIKPADEKPLRDAPLAFARTPMTSRAMAEQETLRQWTEPSGVRVAINSPAVVDPRKPTQLIIYACPNGNTIEQTLGATLEPGMDWHYDIQHVAAQTRTLREVDRAQNYVVAVIEAEGKSWPAWRRARKENGALIRELVTRIADETIGAPVQITLSGHSGGGSFIFGYINGGDQIEPEIERIVWIDANYAYDDAEKHGDKLLAWLKGDANRRLIVFAYNDRAATLNGKPFVSETGGTFYRSKKMIERISRETKLTQKQRDDFAQHAGMNGQIYFMLHTNPQKKILHTVLVERNGLIEAMTWGTKLQEKWGGEFWGERAYAGLIRPAVLRVDPSATTQSTSIPPRAKGAMGGKMFAETIADLPPKARENAIVAEALKGNIPQFLRTFKTIRVSDGKRDCTFEVMPDYLAIGSDEDFVRMPMTPASAKQIASAFGCSLPTRKMVNAIYEQAEVKLEPRPLGEPRETVRRFVEHNGMIEQQRAGKPLGALVVGHKKDVVISNRLKEKPGKVAIYGWHKLDGKPIQPLYVGHVDWYVDYSHGIRLVKNECEVDGKKTTVADVLTDQQVCELLSDEGPIAAGGATYGDRAQRLSE